MELNITAGVFMVLMVAVVAVVFLCCCKAYVLCKRNQLQIRNNQNVSMLLKMFYE